MKYTVYYLYSRSRNNYYVGITNNLHRRLKEHNNNEEVYTKGGAPWELAGHLLCANHVDAIRIEKRLKNAKNKKYTQWFFNQKHWAGSSIG